MSLRERLRAKSRPQATFRLRIDDDAEPQAELQKAVQALRIASLRGEPTDEPQADVDAAQAAVDEHYEILTLTALAPEDMEALIALHPPTKEQRKDEASWNVDTFRPALLEACVEGDMTEDDWREFVTKGNASTGEITRLWEAVVVVNFRGSDGQVGKG